MPEFTESYIALMREKRLERVFREGDWYQYPGEPPEHPPGVMCITAYTALRPDPEFWIWLPLEGDWLDLLEKAGVVGLSLWLVQPGRYLAMREDERHVVHDPSPTRCEALARLYFTVQSAQ